MWDSYIVKLNLPAVAVCLLALVLEACVAQPGDGRPRIEFGEIPVAAVGGSKRMEPIAGKVIGARTGQRVVLYAKSGLWWVQPFSNQPFTLVEKDSSFRTKTHLGMEYAALLVDDEFRPPRNLDELPEVKGSVLAVGKVNGRKSTIPIEAPPKFLQFSGYDWEVLQIPSDSGGVMHDNVGSNVWTDQQGLLHLRMTREAEQWKCAEVILTRSLGYGSYQFVVRKIDRMEPGTVLGMLTWDPNEAGQNHREINIELSKWGDPASKNTQFVIQPYYVAANVYRFNTPSIGLTHSFRWEPSRVSFESRATGGTRLAEHVFTSGIPSPGGERVHLNLYPYGKARTPQQDGIEVVIEKFTYLP